ncbi:hypothetical protein F4556_005229 [Kitasatospora gansuensis]|uniref:Uncharacterized protein n=1 Tax=Kitasatospora gansuensis TaxID=258050 RepID=A0A7W7WKG7_9ACTN|nr:hypothetical protein [Kitasatospora gansuensis]MBB4949694.1 hypothetical protein [Kitasatospora gansuensis]
MDWINPKYAGLVAGYREPLDPEAETFGAPQPQLNAPIRVQPSRAFIMVPLDTLEG